jgi:predicted choloylglycine hydrolase
MKRIILLVAMIALMVGINALPVSASGVSQVDGIYIVTLEGSPHDIGFEQGKLLKDQIKDVYKIYLNDFIYNTWVKQLAMLKGDSAAYSNPRKSVSKVSKTIEKSIPAEYIEEMKGLSEGSGIPFDEVLNMTAHVDYFGIMMCSTFVATGKAVSDGKLVEGRNLDWGDGSLQDMDKYTTLFVVKPDRGHSYISLIYPGIVGALTAVNDAGLSVELNFSLAKEKGASGMPALLIVRHIAQNAGTLDEAEKLLREMPRIAGYNIILTDTKTNDARLVEITAGKVGVRKPAEDGTLVTTNHFTTDELKGENPAKSVWNDDTDSITRYNRLNELLNRNYGKITPVVAEGMIHDNGVKLAGTVQSVIFKLSENKIWVWSRNRKPGDFVEFDIGKLLGK